MSSSFPRIERPTEAFLPIVLSIGVTCGGPPVAMADNPPAPDAAASRESLESRILALEDTLRGLHAEGVPKSDASPGSRSLLADVEIFVKGARWAWRYDTDG